MVSVFEDMLVSLTTRCRNSRELGPRPNSKASTVSCAVEVPYQVEHHWVENWLSPLHNMGRRMDRTARANQLITVILLGLGVPTTSGVAVSRR